MLKRDVLCNVTLHSTSRFNIGLNGQHCRLNLLCHCQAQQICMTFLISVSRYRESIVTSAILVSWDLVSRYIVVSSVSPNTTLSQLHYSIHALWTLAPGVTYRQVDAVGTRLIWQALWRCWDPCSHATEHAFVRVTLVSGDGVRLKVQLGDKYWEDWTGGVWGGALPSPVGGLGLVPRKKIILR